MSFSLKRRSLYPILEPIADSRWESENVFNPAVVYKDGLFHMFYRAQGVDWVSRIGYAVSRDGVHFNRLREPLLCPSDERDTLGLEDPRVTEIDGVFYMTYTAYSHAALDSDHNLTGTIFPMVARSTNLLDWELLGPIVEREDNKDHVIFPQKIGGRYAALHRRRPQVWIAYSDDLIRWNEEDMAPMYGPRADNGWDAASVGSNGVPIKTPHGWISINHAYDTNHVYSLGVILLDLDDPTRIINRPSDRIMHPELHWEIKGDVPHVVFSNANPVVEDTVFVYYGGADHVIGLATCSLEELTEFARFGK